MKRIGKENSQGQTPMWSLSNLASLIKNQADEELLVSPRSSNKYRYQANRAFVIGRMKRVLPKILCGILRLSSVDQLFQDSLRCRSQIIPGRSFRRKMNITVPLKVRTGGSESPGIIRRKAKRRKGLISIIKKLLFDHHFLYFFHGTHHSPY